MSGRTRQAAMLAAGLLLTGCAATDPYARPGMWQPTGANALNLAVMVANPGDLLRGHGDARNDGHEAAPPITRLWSGNPAPLPSGSSQSGPSGPSTPPPPAGTN